MSNTPDERPSKEWRPCDTQIADHLSVETRALIERAIGRRLSHRGPALRRLRHLIGFELTRRYGRESSEPFKTAPEIPWVSL